MSAVKGQIKPKADWCQFGTPQILPKNKQTSLVKFPFQISSISRLSWQKNQILLFIFWENLWRANLLLVLSNLQLPNILSQISQHQFCFRKNQIYSLLNMTLYYIVFMTTIEAAMVCKNTLRPNLISLGSQSKTTHNVDRELYV